MGAGTRPDALMRGKAACLQPRCPRAPAHPTPSRGSREVGAFSHTLQTTLDPAVPLVLPSTFHAPSLWDRQWSQEEMPLVSKIARNGAQGWSSLRGGGGIGVAQSRHGAERGGHRARRDRLSRQQEEHVQRPGGRRGAGP